MDALRENPEVLYGAAVAFVVVVLLTPAVGGMARLLGALDRPAERSGNGRPVPRRGGSSAARTWPRSSARSTSSVVSAPRRSSWDRLRPPAYRSRSASGSTT